MTPNKVWLDVLSECDWKNSGRKVVVLDQAGQEHNATFVAADVLFTDEDEVPLWEFWFGDGSTRSAFDFVKMHYVDEPNDPSQKT